jgi:hypothetical protein|tara:strand:+ start:81 stop:362 length:282 start_codon:yes stop_codon:yes gene_type:complete
MAESPQLSGAPITIPQEDGSSKIYDTGLLSLEGQQAVNMLAFLNQIRLMLNAANSVFSNVVNDHLTDEAMVDTTKATEEVVEDDNDTDETDTK